MSTEIFKQGAEGRLYISEYSGKPCLVKERFIKHYRHPDLDKHLTKERIRTEVKSITRCQAAGVLAPEVYHHDLKERKIYMEFYPSAITAKDYINENVPKYDDEEVQKKAMDKFADQFGQIIGKLHANNIVHGDLTTSNVLLQPGGDELDQFKDYKLVMIDFGLSQYQTSPESKGVDLYVLERALLSTHSTLPTLFEKILEAYSKENQAGRQAVIMKLEEVRARGRKRTMVG